jgi:hypothetical protein
MHLYTELDTLPLSLLYTLVNTRWWQRENQGWKTGGINIKIFIQIGP